MDDEELPQPYEGRRLGVRTASTQRLQGAADPRLSGTIIYSTDSETRAKLQELVAVNS